MYRQLLTTSCMGCMLLFAAPSQSATLVDADGPDSVTGPTFGAPFTVDQLFNATVTGADIDSAVFGGEGQWAGPGAGPHEIFMDYGTSVTASGVAYSQRLGDDPAADKVGTIEFWFSDTDFSGVFPVSPADVVVTITNTSDSVFTNYEFGGTFSGRYVAARFFSAPSAPPTHNPGGSEMRLTIPEPGSMALLAIGGLTLLRRRR